MKDVPLVCTSIGQVVTSAIASTLEAASELLPEVGSRALVQHALEEAAMQSGSLVEKACGRAADFALNCSSLVESYRWQSYVEGVTEPLRGLRAVWRHVVSEPNLRHDACDVLENVTCHSAALETVLMQTDEKLKPLLQPNSTIPLSEACVGDVRLIAGRISPLASVLLVVCTSSQSVPSVSLSEVRLVWALLHSSETLATRFLAQFTCRSDKS